MPEQLTFTGFPQQLITFFQDLEKNNTREWFQKHKPDYETYVLNPAKAFVMDFGIKLQQLIPTVMAIPQVNKSLFRINRDIRFSKNKRPYKTNMGIWFWDAKMGVRMEGSGVYIHYENEKVFIAAGMHIFSNAYKEAYRRKLQNEKKAEIICRFLQDLQKEDNYTIQGKYYKKIPRGYEINKYNEELLKFNGLGASYEPGNIPPEFYTVEFIDFTIEKVKRLMPLLDWITELKK